MTRYTRDQKLKIYENMKKYGGGFVKALAEAIIRADKNNLEKLENAFPEYFNEYLNF